MGIIEIIKNLILLFYDMAKKLLSVQIDVTPEISISYGEIMFLGIGLILLVYFVICAILPKKEG